MTLAETILAGSSAPQCRSRRAATGITAPLERPSAETSPTPLTALLAAARRGTRNGMGVCFTPEKWCSLEPRKSRKRNAPCRLAPGQLSRLAPGQLYGAQKYHSYCRSPQFLLWLGGAVALFGHKGRPETLDTCLQSFSAIISGSWSPLLKNICQGLPVAKVFPSKVLPPLPQALPALDHGGNA